ncbi:MAG: glucosamine-6-phosphate deaminase [Flavobacterium sp.]|nr:glucosamine-6-phosphate deaminase [Pedobacter sp.]
MKIKVHPDYNEMSRSAANFIADFVKNKPDALLCFPSGDTPTGILNCLIEDVRSGKLDFKDCLFAGLDEWVGQDGSDEGSCRHYMDEHFFLPLKIRPEQISFFNGKAVDLKRECRRMDEFISSKGQVDLLMVGLGLNGHVGLNEPGVDFNLYSHISDLHQMTKDSAKKYFNQEVLLTQGITLGPKHILESKVAVLIASGSKKAEILVKALEEEVSRDVPACVLQMHPDSYVFTDREAASLLTKLVQ